MNRRRFLAGASATTMASLAGCFGYTIKSTDDVESRKSKVETLQANLDDNTSALSQTRKELNATKQQLTQTKSELQSAESRINAQATTISELRSDKTDLESDVNELERELSNLEATTEEIQAKTVLTVYSYAIALANDGHDLYRSGDANAGNGDYLAASYDFYEAEPYYRSAGNVYDLAVDRATEFGFGTVSGWCDESGSRIEYYAEAAADYGLAYLNYTVEEYSAGDEYLRQGNSHLETAQSLQSRNLSVLEDELGYTINVGADDSDTNGNDSNLAGSAN